MCNPCARHLLIGHCCILLLRVTTQSTMFNIDINYCYNVNIVIIINFIITVIVFVILYILVDRVIHLKE